MKKLLLILCACAILLSSAACSCSNDTDIAEDETSEIISNESSDANGENKTDGNKNDSSSGKKEDDKDPEASGDSSDSNDVIADSEIMEPEIISKGGTKPGLWPTESVPENVPEFNDYTEMYNVTHDDYDSSEIWYLSFDSTEKSYEEYVEKLIAEGYKQSDKISGFWGNGEQIIDLFTEEVDGEFCVSIDITKCKPVEYPKTVKEIFPLITVSDSTLYGWYEVDQDDGKLFSVSYACGENFAFDLNAYKNQLSEAGFTVTENEATIEKDGKTYTVRYGDAVSAYEDTLEYVY